MLILFVLGLLVINGWFLSRPKKAMKEKKPNKVVVPKEDPLDKKIKSMSLDEKIGLMFFVTFPGTVMNETIKAQLTPLPGGIHIAKENISNYNSTKRLIDEYKLLSPTIFIGIDNEGGIVNRLNNLTDYQGPFIPSMKLLGDKDNEEYTHNIGKQLAKETKKLGVNVDFAPVVDIYENSFIKTRSFSSNPLVINKHAAIIMDELRAEKIIPTLKHFPGHGAVAGDTHSIFPTSYKTLEELETNDLKTYQLLMTKNPEMIMLAHVHYQAFDEEKIPASISSGVVSYLRNNLKYNAVVITDALNMGALSSFSLEEIYTRGIKAGVDMFLMPKDYQTSVKVVKNLVQSQKISEQNINLSVKRILILKDKYLN